MCHLNAEEKLVFNIVRCTWNAWHFFLSFRKTPYLKLFHRAITLLLQSGSLGNVLHLNKMLQILGTNPCIWEVQTSYLRIVKYPNVTASNFPSTTSGLMPYFTNGLLRFWLVLRLTWVAEKKSVKIFDRSLLVEISFKFLKSRNI